MIRREQARSWLIVAVSLAVMTTLVYQALSLAMALVGWAVADFDPTLRRALEWLALVGLAIIGYRVVARWMDRGYFFVRRLVATRNKPWRTAGIQPAVDALSGAAPLGLYLRSYFDEDWLIPRSRAEAPRLLAASGLHFIAVENSQSSFQPHELLILSVPNRVWRETVFTLMEVAQVIVMDTVTDTLAEMDWARELPTELSFRGREAEVVWRSGTVDELEQILERGLSAKTVVLAPKTWREDVLTGKVERQIRVEEAVARMRHAEIQALRGQSATAAERDRITWFVRTRMKRALLRVEHIACSLDELQRLIATFSGATSNTDT